MLLQRLVKVMFLSGLCAAAFGITASRAKAQCHSYYNYCPPVPQACYAGPVAFGSSVHHCGYAVPSSYALAAPVQPVCGATGFGQMAYQPFVGHAVYQAPPLSTASACGCNGIVPATYFEPAVGTPVVDLTPAKSDGEIEVGQDLEQQSCQHDYISCLKACQASCPAGVQHNACTDYCDCDLAVCEGIAPGPCIAPPCLR